MTLTPVVIAAGEGRRLRPLTERWPKPLLPIDGRPVLGTLLRELASSGLGEVTIVVGHLGEKIEEFAGDGAGFGVDVRYARQPQPLGSADAVAHGLAAGAEFPLLVVAADTVFAPGTLGRFIEAWRESHADGGLAVRDVPEEEIPRRSSVQVSDGLVRSVVDKPPAGSTTGTLAAAPLWILGNELAPYLDGLPGPPFEVAIAVQRAIDAGRTVAAVDIGPTRDITRPEDVMVRNFPYLWRTGAT